MAAQRMTKSQFVAAVAQKAKLDKKQAAAALTALNEVIVHELRRKDGQVMIPGLLKLSVTIKPAMPEHPGKNPFTGEPIIVKAKPARKVVKARPIKALKDAL